MRQKKYISGKLSNTELIKAFNEMKSFNRTGVLSEGIVRSIAEENQQNGTEISAAIRLAEEDVLYEIGNRFTKLVNKEKEGLNICTYQFKVTPRG